MNDGVRKLWEEKEKLEKAVLAMWNYDPRMDDVQRRLREIEAELAKVDPSPRGIGPFPSHPGNVGGG